MLPVSVASAIAWNCYWIKIMDKKRQVKYIEEMNALIQDFQSYADACNELWGKKNWRTASQRDGNEIKRDINEYEDRISRQLGRLKKLLVSIAGGQLGTIFNAVQVGWHNPYQKGPLLKPSISILNNILGEIETMSDEDIQEMLSKEATPKPSSVKNFTTNVYGNNSGGINTGRTIEVTDNSSHIEIPANFDPAAQVAILRELVEPIAAAMEERLAERLLRELQDLEDEIKQDRPDKTLLKQAATGILGLAANAVTVGQANLPQIVSNLNLIAAHFGIGVLNVS